MKTEYDSEVKLVTFKVKGISIKLTIEEFLEFHQVIEEAVFNFRRHKTRVIPLDKTMYTWQGKESRLGSGGLLDLGGFNG